MPFIINVGGQLEEPQKPEGSTNESVMKEVIGSSKGSFGSKIRNLFLGAAGVLSAAAAFTYLDPDARMRRENEAAMKKVMTDLKKSKPVRYLNEIESAEWQTLPQAEKDEVMANEWRKMYAYVTEKMGYVPEFVKQIDELVKECIENQFLLTDEDIEKLRELMYALDHSIEGMNSMIGSCNGLLPKDEDPKKYLIAPVDTTEMDNVTLDGKTVKVTLGEKAQQIKNEVLLSIPRAMQPFESNTKMHQKYARKSLQTSLFTPSFKLSDEEKAKLKKAKAPQDLFGDVSDNPFK